MVYAGWLYSTIMVYHCSLCDEIDPLLSHVSEVYLSGMYNVLPPSDEFSPSSAFSESGLAVYQ